MFNIFPTKQIKRSIIRRVMPLIPTWLIGTFMHITISFNEMDYTFNEFHLHKEDFV